MYTCHLAVMRRSLVEELGGLRSGFDGSQDWDLAFRVSEQARRIVHVPRVLYHWRTVVGSAAADIAAKPWAVDAARKAVAEHVERIGLQAEVQDIPSLPGNFRLRPVLRTHPLVSIVIPTRGSVRDLYGSHTVLVVNTIRSVVERSTYDNYELVVVHDDETSSQTLAQIEEIAGHRLRLVPFPRPFSFSQKINVGVLHSAGDYALLLNDDIEVLPPDWRGTWPRTAGRSSWIEAMLQYALLPGVGCVGAKLYFADTRIQHAGVVCVGGGPSHPYRGFAADHAGYFNNALLPTNYLAVTGACLLTPRGVFEEVGGLSRAFPVNFNDIDYGFKLAAHGYRTVFTPDAELASFRVLSRPALVEENEFWALRTRWANVLDDDPFYRGFRNDSCDFLLPHYRHDGQFA